MSKLNQGVRTQNLQSRKDILDKLPEVSRSPLIDKHESIGKTKGIESVSVKSRLNIHFSFDDSVQLNSK